MMFIVPDGDKYLADRFWRRLIREYMPQLQVRTKWLLSHRNVMVGDLVLLLDESTPGLCGHWLWLLRRRLIETA